MMYKCDISQTHRRNPVYEFTRADYAEWKLTKAYQAAKSNPGQVMQINENIFISTDKASLARAIDTIFRKDLLQWINTEVKAYLDEHKFKYEIRSSDEHSTYYKIKYCDRVISIRISDHKNKTRRYNHFNFVLDRYTNCDTKRDVRKRVFKEMDSCIKLLGSRTVYHLISQNT